MSQINIPNDYPVELTTPDIEPYAAGNTGIPYIWRFESGRPGPNVMVSAIVHGNEPCGAIALDKLLREEVRPVAGSLTLAFMNVAAYHAFDPADPNATRWLDEDFNRVWGLDVLEGDRNSRELAPEPGIERLGEFDVAQLAASVIERVLTAPGVIDELVRHSQTARRERARRDNADGIQGDALAHPVLTQYPGIRAIVDEVRRNVLRLSMSCNCENAASADLRSEHWRGWLAVRRLCRTASFDRQIEIRGTAANDESDRLSHFYRTAYTSGRPRQKPL